MRQHLFGNTDLLVSELGFGCARLGGVFGSDTERDLLKTLREAFNNGITFFDTADMYTQGESEKLLGEAFRRDRDKVVIASKGGYCLPSRKSIVSKAKPYLRPIIQRTGIRRPTLPSSIAGSISQDFSGPYLVRAVERSLRRLGTDYLDLYQLHSPPMSVIEQGDVFSVLERLQQAGKIRHYGVSCETTEDALLCMSHSDVSSLQIRVSLLDQSALEQALPMAAERGIAVIARECFAGGVLAKKSDRRFAGSGFSALVPAGPAAEYLRVAEQLGRPLPEVALQFALSLRGVSVALAGMRTRIHLAESLQYARAVPLSDAELSMLCSPVLAQTQREGSHAR